MFRGYLSFSCAWETVVWTWELVQTSDGDLLVPLACALGFERCPFRLACRRCQRKVPVCVLVLALVLPGYVLPVWVFLGWRRDPPAVLPSPCSPVQLILNWLCS